MNRTENLQLRQTLASLVGLPLTCLCRVADLTMWDFGVQNLVTTKSGWKFFSDWAIHIQCAWRLLSSDAILVASEDITRSVAGEPVSDLQAGATLLDYRLQTLKLTGAALRVTSIESSHHTDLRIDFDRGLQLQILTLTSTRDSEVEFWRLIEMSGAKRHFVAKPSGIEVHVK